jgi:peptidoglycan/LPS O-acetylase OafA/YrhL
MMRPTDLPPRVHQGLNLPTLDGWRAVAIGAVVVSHAADQIGHSFKGLAPAVDALTAAGLLGVQIFFGLSGFLITSRLLHEEQKHGRISLRSFYVRRFFRIVPPAFVFLAVVGTLAHAGILRVSLGRWLSALLCFANYSWARGSWYVGHFWSLAVEEHFYLLWPAAFLLLRAVRRRVAAVVIAAVLLALWRAVAFKFRITVSSLELFWARTDIQGDGLLWGVCVALLAADPTWGPRIRAALRSPWARLAATSAVFTLGFIHGVNWKLAFVLLSVKAIAIPLMIFGTVLVPHSTIGHLLENRCLRWIGVLSYSIYLWQQLFVCLEAERVPILRPVQTFPGNLVATLVMAALSYYLVEPPLIAFGRRFAKGRPAATLPASATPRAA